MSSTTYVDHPLDTTISDALTDLALDLRWSFNHCGGSALGATRPRTLGTDAQSMGPAANRISGKTAKCYCRPETFKNC